GGYHRPHRWRRQVALVPFHRRGWLAAWASLEDGDLDVTPALQRVDVACVDLQFPIPFRLGERLGRGSLLACSAGALGDGRAEPTDGVVVQFPACHLKHG